MNKSIDDTSGNLKEPLKMEVKGDNPGFDKGFSSMELTIIIVILCAFFLAAGVMLKVTSKSAYNITAKHDLKAFADYQDFYFKLNNRCLGELGQSLRNDGIPSDLIVENYTVSEGVCITIISGSSEDPNDRDNPFKLQAKHEKSDTVFEYNFQNGKMTER